MSKGARLSNQVSLPLLRFLWRWKLVSTAALALRFFPQRKTPRSAYNYLCELRRAHYVSSVALDGSRGAVWTLDRAGFDAIRPDLPELREEGYKSENQRHDWTASVFHLGEWFVKPPLGVEVFSEQELRRLEPEHYPAWVPKDVSHRPDGYWHRVDGTKLRTVALEMELNRKKASSYQSIGSFYGEARQVGRVLWIVPARGDSAKIDSALAEGPGSRPDMHSFVCVDSFLEQGWSAPVERGAGQGYSIETYLQKALGLPVSATPVQSGCSCTLNALFETRIRLFDTAPYGHEARGRFSRLTPTSVGVSPAPHETRLIDKPEVSR